MHDADAFEDDVSAYPAVTIIRHAPQGRAVLATATSEFDARESEFLRKWVTNGRSPRAERRGYRAERLEGWFPGDELWPSGEPNRLALVSELERRFAPLQDASTGTRVGIGLASGADDVYVTTDPALVEPERLLPMVMAGDIASGRVRWSGEYLVNPWDRDGLVDLAGSPRLAAYFRQHEERLRLRHVAKRRPAAWYRTIDRVAPDLLAEPKLLLPDIKAASHPVLEEGRYYPHHNLYFVVSRKWDLEVLGGLLLSEVANLFVGAYCVKMRGGCYRFQAQYIRKMRTPHPSAVGRREARALAKAFAARDVQAATAAAIKVYGIEPLPGWT
jgi:hypothetical protein